MTPRQAKSSGNTHHPSQHRNPLFEPPATSPGVPPVKAANPTPADAVTGVDATVTQPVGWANSGNTDWTRAQMFFGTDPAALLPSWDSNLNAVSSWSLGGGAIMPGMTYCWRVDLTNVNGTTTGDVWSFSTGH